MVDWAHNLLDFASNLEVYTSLIVFTSIETRAVFWYNTNTLHKIYKDILKKSASVNHRT